MLSCSTSASSTLLCSASARRVACHSPQLWHFKLHQARLHQAEHVRGRVFAKPLARYTSKANQPGTLLRLCYTGRSSPNIIRTYADRHGPVNEHAEDQRKHQTSSPTSTKSLSDKLDATKQRTKHITSKVRSSLTSLTPHENIYNVPNILTASRLIAAPAVGYLVLHDQHKYALALFAYAGITDLVDGWIARHYKLQTVVGSVIDPMADKVLMTILTVTLAVKGLLPAYLATLILGRDVALAGAAIYYRYASLPAPKTMQRYWDFSLPSAEVHPTTMSKFNTFLQLLLIGSTLAYPVVTADSHHLGVMYDLGLEKVSLDAVMTGFQWVVAGTTVWSGLSYSYLKNAVTILGKDEALKLKQGRRGRAIIGATFGSVVAAALWLALTDRSEQDEAVDE
ncbi:hypothetical protein AAFC00_000038 [Neodothiora populina]|uniref:Cardiolipin synthetase n=1 Tax=Neodothiora populina TaxID=2781224 RepID=A0ABR3P1C6_9PEZI